MGNPVKDALSGSYYYESKKVGKTRSLKNCGVCGSSIPKGSSHNIYTLFNDEYSALNVCSDCETKYKKEINDMKNGEYDDYD